MSTLDLDKIVNNEFSWSVINIIDWFPTLWYSDKKILTHIWDVSWRMWSAQNTWWYDVSVVETLWTTKINWYFLVSPDENTLKTWSNTLFKNQSSYFNPNEPIKAESRIVTKNPMPIWLYQWILIKNVTVIDQTSWGWFTHTNKRYKFTLVKIASDWTRTEIGSSSLIDSSSIFIDWTPTSFNWTDRLGLEIESFFDSTWNINNTRWISISAWFWEDWDIIIF